MLTVVRSCYVSFPTLHQHAGLNRPWNRMLRSGNKDLCESKPSKLIERDQRSSKIYRTITLFVALPIVLIMSGIQWANHRATVAEGVQRPEFVQYPYLRIRTKRFPWGDGNKTLFHHPYKNALPDGYEEDLESTNN